MKNLIKITESVIINEEYMLEPGDSVRVLAQDASTEYSKELDPEGTQFYNTVTIKTHLNVTELASICSAALNILNQVKGLNLVDGQKYLDSEYGRDWAKRAITDQWDNVTTIISNLSATLD